MRLLHTADWHLGRTLHRVPLLDAQRSVLDHLVEVAREERVDAILLAGDVFDRALPPVEAVRVAGDALRRLAEVAPVVAISGNHDSAGRLGFAAELIAAGGVHLRTEPRTSGDAVVLHDEHGPVAIYGVPYLDPDLAREQLGVEERSHEAVLGAAMDLVREDLAGRRGDGQDGGRGGGAGGSRAGAAGGGNGGAGGGNGAAGGGNGTAGGRAGETPGRDARLRAVVVAHAFVQGGEASESERDISIGGAQTVPSAVFAGADYVALGHLHRPHAVGVGAGDAEADGLEDATGATGAGAPSPPALAPTPADAMSALAQAELGGLFALPLEDAAPVATAVEPEPEPASPTAAPGAVRYAGSPLPYSFTEADAPKSTAIVDLAADGSSTVRFVPVPAPFRLVRLRGELEELLGDPALAEHESEDAWVEVVLTDALLPARPMERLRRRFPRVLVLQHAPEGERSPATVARDRIRGRSDLEILERFVDDVRGSAPDEHETPLLREAAEQVGRDREDEDA
jgi:exonuclease SbcD